MAAFLADIEELHTVMTTSLDALKNTPNDTEAMMELKRVFHSLKSSSGMMGDTDLSRTCLDLEALLGQVLLQKRPCPQEVIDKSQRIVSQLQHMLHLKK